MPMKCKPGGKITVCLECDKDDPVETRTVFYGRVLSMSESLEIDERMKNTEFDTAKEILEDRVKLLLENLVDPGWKNLDCTFDKADPKPLMDTLTQQETVELIRAIQYGNTTTEEEKKS